MPVTYWQHVARDARLYLILSSIGHEHDVQVLRIVLRTESRHEHDYLARQVTSFFSGHVLALCRSSDRALPADYTERQTSWRH